MTKPIKPYYRRGNKYFFRKGKKRMWVNVVRDGVGMYNIQRGGDVILNVTFVCDFAKMQMITCP